jgi:GNAT superfamily N-acetyltransferase
MISIRPATEADLPAVVRLYAIPDDGNQRDEGATEPLERHYAEALAEIGSDFNNLLMVAEVAGQVVGTFQLTMVRHLAWQGSRVAYVESVFVDPSARSTGVGTEMMKWAIGEAKRRECFRIQLTSNKRRSRAHDFYGRLGFAASHEGMKLVLTT